MYELGFDLINNVRFELPLSTHSVEKLRLLIPHALQWLLYNSRYESFFFLIGKDRLYSPTGSGASSTVSVQLT